MRWPKPRHDVRRFADGLSALSCAAVAVATVTILSAQTPSQVADLVLRGGRVITLDANDRVAEAIAVRGNRILAVGSNAEIVVLSDDVLSIPPARLAQVKVDATIVDGPVRYERPERGATNGQ